MKKKIFILTGEPSGDKLAYKVISKIKKMNSNIEYLSVGGENLNSLKIKSIYDIKEITYLGFTKVFFNLFKINKKINYTVKKIVEFDPDILFSVDSPDFALRVAKKVKKIKPKIKTIHFVAPQIWVWRENRLKKIKKFVDHILLLFPFEKKYFDKEGIKSTFIGHPLLENNETSKIDINQIILSKKRIFSIFPGSRSSEINILSPVLFNFIRLMNNRFNDILFIFHLTLEQSSSFNNLLKKENLKNCEVISNSKIKAHILKNSFFALAKSGTISLEICNAGIPSVIIYKMNTLNFLIIKLLVKVKFANIINIAANEEIIPELIQSKCKSVSIFEKVNELLENKEIINTQLLKTQKVLSDFKVKNSSEAAASILNSYL